MLRKHRLATVVSLALLVTGSASNNAFACCGDGAIAAQGAASAGSAVVSSIGAATSTISTLLTTIQTTMSNGFTNLYGEMAKQTAQYKTINEGVVAANSSLYMTQVQAEASSKYEVSPRACYEASMGAATSLSHAEVKAAHADLNQISTKRNLYTPSTAAAVQKVTSTHAEKYCSDADAQLGRCTAVSSTLQNADVKADTLLNQNSMSSDQLAAAQAYVTNVTNPIPTQQIPKKWESTPQGKAFLAGQYVEQARMSVAENSLNASIASRTPITGLGTAAQLNKADVSETELMESIVRGRFESPDWYTMVAGFSTDNLLREQNKMLAFQLWMDLKSYQQFERVETILATQLAMEVKADGELRNARAREVAAKAGE